MKVLVQRVLRAKVTVNGTVEGEIGKGLLLFLGVRNGDTESEAAYCAEKCVALRVFDDTDGKMNLSVQDVEASVLVVSQFTLYGDTRKGNRPSYSDAAPPQAAEQLYERFIAELKKRLGERRVASGVFRAMMDVELVNDGPVTLMIESKDREGV